MPIQPSSVIDDYRIGPFLGEGDMGSVYQAQSLSTQEIVALKVLDKVDTTSAMRREAAVELVQFAADLKHDQLQPISRCLNLDTDGGMLILVTPFAPARSIYDHLQKGTKIPPKQIFKIIVQISGALQFLHSQEVAHGSVKPTNVLLDAQGNATLTDLPMAHLRELGFVPPMPSMLQQYYMQPEFAFNASPEIIGDIFSLGVLAYHLLTGRIPFDELEPLARVEPPPATGLPDFVHPVLLRAMTDRRRLRYQTIKSFMGDLQGALRGQIDPETQRLFGSGNLPNPSDGTAE